MVDGAAVHRHRNSRRPFQLSRVFWKAGSAHYVFASQKGKTAQHGFGGMMDLQTASSTRDSLASNLGEKQGRLASDPAGSLDRKIKIGVGVRLEV